jgi:hypothetical protein
MKRESWWGRQLQREDLLTTLEQGRRVEVELFQEKHRGLRTMGELLKARMFGATEYAINLRKRMTNYVGAGGAKEAKSNGVSGTTSASGSQASPDPHSWPCDDPFCQPCEAATKRLLRDVGVLPRKGVKR